MTVVELIQALEDAPDDAEINVVFERLVGEDIQESPPFVIDNVDVIFEQFVEIRCQERTT